MSFELVQTISYPDEIHQAIRHQPNAQHYFEEAPILRGLLSNCKQFWLAKGPYIEIRNVDNGKKLESWRFGGVAWHNTTISSVEELKLKTRLCLVISLNCPLTGGSICVFDVFGSKVLRTIRFDNETISYIHVIDGAHDDTKLPQRSPLSYFDGIVAVGTLMGNVYLVDICKQICEKHINEFKAIRNENNPCELFMMNNEKLSNIKKYVTRAMSMEEHLAIHLNRVPNATTEHFVLKGQKGDDRVHVERSEVEISCLYYSPQLAALLVGFNFGAFQLWDIQTMKIIYTSPICEGNIPITHFMVQEPADDPKAYCYIWVSYSYNLLYQSGLPFAVMYSLYFDNKNFVDGYGSLYENFQHCSIRFQMELDDCQSDNTETPIKGGSTLKFQAINLKRDNLTLGLISWLFWDVKKCVKTGLLLFDLNQWYKEQMPKEINLSNATSYALRHNLNGMCMDLRLDPKRLSPFWNVQRLEEHFYPNSISFYLLALKQDSIEMIEHRGAQQLFLDEMLRGGHLTMLKPSILADEIVPLGLTPMFCDISNTSWDTACQRDLLMKVALDQGIVGYICDLVNKLANNAFEASGLTFYSVIDWAFQRAVTIKDALHKYCIPLFDYSGTRLDEDTLNLIRCGTRQLSDLCNLYRYILNKLKRHIVNENDLMEQLKSLENVVVYFEVLLWMTNYGILPESKNNCPYLIDELVEYYNQKRAQLRMSARGTFVENDSLLFVDCLMNNECLQLWQEDGGSGLYPPPSIQSVLRTYLLEGQDILTKHSLVTYVLLDVAMSIEGESEIKKNLIKFPQIFRMGEGNIKLVQAFWNLDHDRFDLALEMILSGQIDLATIQQWHHSIMMRSLLVQNQQQLALTYLLIRKPPMETQEDLLTAISLYVSSNMVNDAFQFRAQFKGTNEDVLLNHIYSECKKYGILHNMLYRQLNATEEKEFIKFLTNSHDRDCEDLQIFYYLVRSRYIEAFDIYDKSDRHHPDNKGLVGQGKAATVDAVVKIFKSIMPRVTRNVVELVQKQRTNIWKLCERPKPFSVFVHNAQEQVVYKSSVILAALNKTKQIFVNGTMNNSIETDSIPFLRNPTLAPEHVVNTPTVRSKMVNEDTADGPTPCKRLRLSPRVSTLNVQKQLLNSSVYKMSTPIVKRKRSLEDVVHGVTPQSILKSRSFFEDTPRKSSHIVKFDDLKYSSSNATTSSDNNYSLPTPTELVDEVFYSPEKNVIEEPVKKNVEEDRKTTPESLPAVKFDSPKARKSYKRSHETTADPQISSMSSSAIITRSKIGGRRSLARSVLENNALSRMSDSKFSDISAGSSLESFYLSEMSSDWSFMDSDKERVVSKTTELINVSVYKESVQNSTTGAAISTEESKDESRVTTIEEMAENVTKSQLDEKIDIYEDLTNGSDDLKQQEEEIDIYEDLTSGSEDLKQVLESIKQGLPTTETQYATDLPAVNTNVIEINSSSEESKHSTDSDTSTRSSVSVRGSDVDSSDFNLGFRDSDSTARDEEIDIVDTNQDSMNELAPIVEESSNSSVESDKRSISLQCTLGPVTPVAPVVLKENDSPLVLRTVKRTYQKGGLNLDETTPKKLTRELTIRLSTREILNKEQVVDDQLQRDSNSSVDNLDTPNELLLRTVKRTYQRAEKGSTMEGVDTPKFTGELGKSRKLLLDEQEGSDDAPSVVQSDSNAPISEEGQSNHSEQTMKENHTKLNQDQASDVSAEMSIVEVVTTPSRRSSRRRSSSQAPSEESVVKNLRSRRSSVTKSEPDVEESPKSRRRTVLRDVDALSKELEVPPAEGTAKKVGRPRKSTTTKKSSGDAVTIPRRRGRSQSVDEQLSVPKKRGERSKSIDLPTIDELPIESKHILRNFKPGSSVTEVKKAANKLQDYSSTRRLTRRQCEAIAAHSVDLKDEISPSTSQKTGIDKKTLKAQIDLNEEGAASSIKLRPRRASADSVTSESSPPKLRKTRQRTYSDSSEASNDSKRSTRSTRGRRAASQLSQGADLPEITEEGN